MYLEKYLLGSEVRWSLDSRLLPAEWSLGDLLKRPANEAGDYLKGLAVDKTAPDSAARRMAPIDDCHEVWASGVTYVRSRDARRSESKGSDFYDRVYDAERPELFIKAIGWRVVGPEQAVRVRADSSWNVPEPELVLVLNESLETVGFTIGNDVSSRSIEGDNPLYLPQAKIFDGGCAIGPRILIPTDSRTAPFAISMRIVRGGSIAYEGTVSTTDIRRPYRELASWLGKHLSFPTGAFLMTGTGLVPDDDFSLTPGDALEISIPDIGTLRNLVTPSQ